MSRRIYESQQEKESTGNNPRPGCILAIVLLLLGIAVYAWQMRTGQPSYTIVGLGILVSGLPGWILLLNGKRLLDDLDNSWSHAGCQVSFLIVPYGIVAVILGGYLALFNPTVPGELSDAIPLLSTNRNQITIEWVIEPQEFSIGENGSVSVFFVNIGDDYVEIPEITLHFPNDFFEGFIIDYPTTPPHTSIEEVRTTILGPSHTSISFEGTGLHPGDAFIVQIPVVANNSGDFSGEYTMFSSLKIGSSHFGMLQNTTDLNVIVLP